MILTKSMLHYWNSNLRWCQILSTMPSGKGRVIMLRVGNHHNVNIFSDIILVRAVIQELVKSWAVLQTTEYGLIFYAALHFPFRMHLSWNTKTCVKSKYVQLLNKLHAMAVLIEIAWRNIAHGRVTKTSKITKVFWSTFSGNVLSNTFTIGIKVEAKAVGF